MIAGSKTAIQTSRNHVVFIHGLGAARPIMWPLAWQIKKQGFSTSTFGYPSWWWSIEHHAKRFEACLAKFESDPDVESVSVVAHSMGGIVTRQAILNSKFRKIRRIVMLASPNQGSPVAKALGYALPFCKTLRQVSNRPDSFVLNLPEPENVEVGIIAAQFDRVIPERNSHLECETDHVTIFSGHNGLLVRPTAVRLVATFLKNGSF